MASRLAKSNKFYCVKDPNIILSKDITNGLSSSIF